MEASTVAKRKYFTQSPGQSFTLVREEFKRNEDLRLIKHFAAWLSEVGEHPVREEHFEEDLLDGLCLCKLMTKLRGSGLKNYHTLPSSHVVPLESFKAKENMVAFQLACENLHLPITFGTEDLEKKNITRVISSLIFIAHVAHSQGVGVRYMDQEILDKVKQMDEAIAASTQLSWFQQLLVNIGLGDWIDLLSIDALKKYLATLKQNLEEKVEVVNQQAETLQAALKEALPEAIKSKIPVN